MIFDFHPEPWGRWTHFWLAHIFSDGLGKKHQPVMRKYTQDAWKVGSKMISQNPSTHSRFKRFVFKDTSSRQEPIHTNCVVLFIPEKTTPFLIQWGYSLPELPPPPRVRTPRHHRYDIAVHVYCRQSLCVPSLKPTAKAPENKPFQKETRIPTIFFQVRTVSFRDGNLYI